MESQTEAKSEAKSDPPVVSKQELDEMIPEEINGGIITATNIEIKKEPREEETNTTEVNQSTMDFENFIGNNDPINIKSEDVNTIIDTDEKETYQHMMIGAGISLEDEVEKKPQLNLKGEVIDMEPGDVKDEPAEESSESSSSEEDSSEESPPSTTEHNNNEYGYRLNKRWLRDNSDQPSNKEKRFVCCSCDYQHNLAGRMRKHLIIHSAEKSYQCSQCPMRTRHKICLREHIKYVHSDPGAPKAYSCESCDFKTNRRESFKKHSITHLEFGCEKKPVKIDWYKCEICDFKSKKKFFVDRHVNIHRPPSEKEVYKCELCPYTSAFPGKVHDHMTVHKKPSETTMYECEVCPYKSKWPHCLRNHLKTHKKVPVHKCEHCDFETNNRYSVATHKKFTHKELYGKPKKEYKCDICNYMGKTSSCLDRHKIVHKKMSKDEMFTCAICGMQTKIKRSLRNHILTVHGFLEKNKNSTE